MQLNPVLFVFLGGGLGASLRYLLSQWIRQSSAAQSTFPWPVFSCNLIGCLLIGVFAAWLNTEHPHWLHPLFVTGLLGGFTTFSSFALDTHTLIQNGAYFTAGSYALGSLILGLLACALSYSLTTHLLNP